MVNSKDAYETQDDLARLQENARFAMNLLIKDIRMAGYFGCNVDPDRTFDHIDNGGAGNLFDSNFGLEGMNNYDNSATWEPSGVDADIDAVAGLSYLPGSDGLTIRYLDPASAVSIDENMPQPSAEMKVDSVGNLVDGQIVAISDCSNTDIIQLTNVQSGSLHLQHNSGTGTPGNVNSNSIPDFPSGCNAPNCLSKAYGEGAQVMSMKAVRYFLHDDDGDGNPSLHRLLVSPSGGNAVTNLQKLVNGVDSLQVTFGEDTTGNSVADTYGTADSVTNWSNVSTVRIGMLLNTVDEYGQQINTTAYTVAAGNSVNGEDFPAQNDRRRRRLFTATVLLRNPQ
jgi:type IV pilus assembly protein PilW